MRLAGRTRRAGAAVAIGALAALGLGLNGGLGGPVTDSAAAQPTAHASQPYTYLKTRGLYRDTTVYGGRSWSVYQPVVVERWIAADGSGRQRQLSLVPRFVSPTDRQTWQEVGKPKFLAYGFHAHLGEELLPAGSFQDRLYGTDLLSTMPGDPDAVASWLVARVHDPAFGGNGNGFPDSVKTIELATDLLANPSVSPSQRSLLIEAEARVPGVENLGPARDVAGRTGVALGARSANSGLDEVYSLIFDPESAQLLGSETRLATPPAGDALGLDGGTAYLREGEVRSRFARPHRVKRHR
jgi:hypothetical protein